ncbi:MAG: hypothetical protein M1820_004457 [Bogoriella megaspora]|nr:MAG: hypothetical protein M1820_004457 [Bogoriella megaspora]
MKSLNNTQNKSLPPMPPAESEDERNSFNQPPDISQGAPVPNDPYNTAYNREETETPTNAEIASHLSDLEKALKTARTEQQRMSSKLQELQIQKDEALKSHRHLEETTAKLRLDHEQELHSLRSKLAEESESSTYWARKHSTVLNDLNALKTRFLERDAMWKSEWERKAAQLMGERDGLVEKLHGVQRGMEEKGKEAEEARRQLVELKQGVARAGRVEEQISDEEVRERLAGLRYEIENWVVGGFRRGKGGNLSSTARRELEQSVPLYRSVFKDAKLVLYQAFVMDKLMSIFDAPLYFGLPKDGPLGHVATLNEYLESIGLDSAQWRSITLGMVDQDQNGDLAKHTKILTAAIQSKVETVLSQLTANQFSSTQKSGLSSIINNAVKITRLVRRQRARFVFELPKVSPEREARFDDDVMEDINGGGEDDDDDEQHESNDRKIRCATFPVVYKMGDERGENLHLRNVIYKARVF